MAFTEGSSSRVDHRPDGRWYCTQCDYSNDEYQPVIGHLGKHTVGRKPPGRPKQIKVTDPLDLSVTQLILRLEEAEAERDKLRTLLQQERKHTADIRYALSSFMRTTAE